MNAKLRLIIFASVVTILVFVVFVLLTYSSYQSLAAALLGAIPIATLVSYDRFVNVPDLEISYDPTNKDLHRPSLLLYFQHRVAKEWHFLRLNVKNVGFGMARNCIAELRVTGRPQKDHSECPAPAREPKGLKWAGSAAFATKNIYPRGGEGIVDVLIVDRTLSKENRMNWGTKTDSENWGPLEAWAATHEVYGNLPENRKQDGFCQGRYQIVITVFAENGAPARKKYSLTIDEDWEKIEMNPSDCSQ